jgi:saccharopine dehydrogenase-like NADP-dependent oxidoreductase
MIGAPTIADAILHRLVHNAHRITLAGEHAQNPARVPLDRDGESRNHNSLNHDKAPMTKLRQPSET